MKEKRSLSLSEQKQNMKVEEQTIKKRIKQHKCVLAYGLDPILVNVHAHLVFSCLQTLMQHVSLPPQWIFIRCWPNLMLIIFILLGP